MIYSPHSFHNNYRLKLCVNTSDTTTKWSAKVTAGVYCLCLSISSSKQEILKQKFAMANFGIFSIHFNGLWYMFATFLVVQNSFWGLPARPVSWVSPSKILGGPQCISLEISTKSTPILKTLVEAIKHVTLLQNSWIINSLISDVEPDVNISISLWLVLVTGIPRSKMLTS